MLSAMADVALPEMVEIEPTEWCNLRCTMCHVSYMPNVRRPLLDPALLDRLDALAGRYFVIGSGFEPMMHPAFEEIARWLARKRAKVEIVTNATYLHGEAADALADVDLAIMTFSFDGIRPATYEAIRRRAAFAPTMEKIRAFRARFAGHPARFAINSTMMRSNIDEIPEMIEAWDALDFDLLRLIAMVVREPAPALLRESLWPVRERYADLVIAAGRKIVAERRRLGLFSPVFQTARARRELGAAVDDASLSSGRADCRAVPRVRQDVQAVAYPGMRYPCRSPWTFARIHASGEVLLCNAFPVGNLRDETFEAIWFGARAEAVRARVLAETETCDRCDYFRFCLSSQQIDYDSPREFLAGHLADMVERIDFAAGSIAPGAAAVA
jgi:radical SAM protein with 4Fe4S-binding SPASM domain